MLFDRSRGSFEVGRSLGREANHVVPEPLQELVDRARGREEQRVPLGQRRRRQRGVAVQEHVEPTALLSQEDEQAVFLDPLGLEPDRTAVLAADGDKPVLSPGGLHITSVAVAIG